MLKLATEPKLPEEEKAKLAQDTLSQICGPSGNDFFKWGTELKGYGDRYVKYSDKKEEHGFNEGDKFFGEWSKETNKPHGRGIYIASIGDIFIGYYNNGDAPGRYITIHSDGDVDVGEYYLKNGERWARGTQYYTDGTTEEFDE